MQMHGNEIIVSPRGGGKRFIKVPQELNDDPVLRNQFFDFCRTFADQFDEQVFSIITRFDPNHGHIVEVCFGENGERLEAFQFVDLAGGHHCLIHIETETIH